MAREQLVVRLAGFEFDWDQKSQHSDVSVWRDQAVTEVDCNSLDDFVHRDHVDW